MKPSLTKFNVSFRLQRIILWSSVILYTLCLPSAFIVYRSIVNRFSSQAAGKVPLYIMLAFTLIYTIVGLLKKRTARCLIVLAVGGIIVILVMNLEANANKHIHIPEYILMSWILYLALALDYSGSGISLLVFICAAMLGVVDEILQGIHLQRSYGWTDMLVDTAASFIGCLTIMALKQPAKWDWRWCRDLRHFKGALVVISFGVITALPMGSLLLSIPETGSFFEVYPGWLLAGNGLFVAACLVLITYHWRRKLTRIELGPAEIPATGRNHTTAMLWVMCPMAILMAMHALVLWVAMAGIDFQ